MRRRLTGPLLGGLALALVPFLSAPADAVAPFRHACATPRPGHASCSALVRSDIAQSERSLQSAAAAPAGLAPADLQSAYKLPSSIMGYGQTVAIVDAYDAPTVEADLGVYRSQFGLSACTTANGCFRKVDQNGGTSYPKQDGGWAQEISLDVEMVSAVCPNCRILLVEARSPSFADLGAAVNTAARLSHIVSNSYGGSEASDAKYGHYYDHPGVVMTVSSGDSGYGVEYPASSHYVTAVGGTTLRRASGTRGWTETAWSGAGSGCSASNSALSGQAAVGTGCPRRAVADVSAVADPATGVAVYDSTAYQGQSGWLVFGGTSVAAPVVAGVYGLAGNAPTVTADYSYAHANALFDVTSGSNGSCPTSQWCHARPGWDGPTGLGTPNGTGAF